jgi:hypothetical protein
MEAWSFDNEAFDLLEDRWGYVKMRQKSKEKKKSNIVTF